MYAEGAGSVNGTTVLIRQLADGPCWRRPHTAGMRRRLRFVVTMLVLTGGGCGSSDVGGGTTSPPTGTTLARTVAEAEASAVDGPGSEEPW